MGDRCAGMLGVCRSARIEPATAVCGGVKGRNGMFDQVMLLTDAMETAGHRVTRSRRTIVETLVNSGGHVTADELALRVRDANPRIGRMTVYRTLNLLVALGQIRPIYQGTGAAHFVIMTEGSHHHLICSNCHRTIEFDHCSADDVLRELALKYSFRVQSHLLEVHGLCADCHTPG